MKKKILWILLAVSIFMLAGCGKKVEKEKRLSAGEIQVNTLLIGKNEEVQSSIVEEFEKDYYKQDELENFIQEEVKKYTKKNGEDSVSVYSLHVKEQVASVVLNYKTMDDYEKFNQVEAKYYTMEEAISKNVIPETMMIVDKDGEAGKAEIEENEKCKVVVVQEELDVIVDGVIKYYSNGAILNQTTMQSSGDGVSVIVFK